MQLFRSGGTTGVSKGATLLHRNILANVPFGDREAKTQSIETLYRLADVKVQRREHRDDGLLTEHSVNMPKKPLPPTMIEVEQKIAEALAEIDDRIAAAFEARAWQHDAHVEAVGDALGTVRQQLRAEFAEQLGLLRADVEIQTKAAESRAHGGGDVVEMPQFLERRRA